MKINPTAIQSYQQLVQRQPQRPDEQARPADAARELTIAPQAAASGSDLAVKAPEGSYADFLTEAERAALELLFQRFGDSGRFGAALGGEAAESRVLGKLIDVKV
ncbi:MAG TPA: hypothetical protein PKM94_01830 [candidate division Zixibacteria bacterium]|nr:hypothetical protein [candidate division Zixibacteria bacterium]MDD4917137.1 hypothetical protein [candidate division Zixibacteria bacterium]MDM7972679.1 hypothetical protein [candidate division Zixibacteria bacterium]HOD65405.1 hypothetical protein [candidate division Zixibacteria bacterium]HQL22939.1 hypothetical protein [candidate division Zixibacteria bacterium]